MPPGEGSFADPGREFSPRVPNDSLTGKKTSPNKHGKTQMIQSPFIYDKDGSRFTNAMVYGTIDRSEGRKKEKLRIRKIKLKKAKNYNTVHLNCRS